MMKRFEILRHARLNDPEWNKISEFATKFMADHNMNIIEFCYRCKQKSKQNDIDMSYHALIDKSKYRHRVFVDDLLKAMHNGPDMDMILDEDKSYINSYLKYMNNHSTISTIDIYDKITLIHHGCPADKRPMMSLHDVKKYICELLPKSAIFINSLEIEEEHRMCLVDHMM